MSITPGSPDEARLLLDLQDKLQSRSAREAFAFLHLNFARMPGCQCEAEAHGMVSSLRVRDHGDWCYSFSTARDWVLAYVRPPEYRKGRLTLKMLQSRLPDASDGGDEHLRVRLHTVADAQAFFSVVSAAQEQGEV